MNNYVYFLVFAVVLAVGIPATSGELSSAEREFLTATREYDRLVAYRDAGTVADVTQLCAASCRVLKAELRFRPQNARSAYASHLARMRFRAQYETDKIAVTMYSDGGMDEAIRQAAYLTACARRAERLLQQQSSRQYGEKCPTRKRPTGCKR